MTKKLAWIQIERGILASVWSEQGLYELTFPYPSQQEARTHLTTSGLSEAALAPAQQEWLKRLTNQLREFFDGKPVAFSVPLDWTGYSEFRLKALQFTAAIPPGQVATYGGVAAAVGRPGAARAVGAKARSPWDSSINRPRSGCASAASMPARRAQAAVRASSGGIRR